MVRALCLLILLDGVLWLMPDAAGASEKSVAGPASGNRGPAEGVKELVLQSQYLNLPVKNGAAKRRMSLSVDGRIVREFEIELAEGEPDFWVFLDVGTFRGKKTTIRVASLSRNSAAWQAIVQSDAIKGTEDLYREKHRPQFHFSSRRGWNNDPNGLVFYQGEYHLFYQHNPYGWNWGNMHWGHAVSTDLVHWKELPIALYPQKFGDWCFSGSAVVDRDNTAGFKTGEEDVIVAAYTSTGRGECIAYSNDRGRTFTDYEGNPVVTHKGRDPKVIWYAPGRHWVMARTTMSGSKSRGISFYTSHNLKEWQFAQPHRRILRVPRDLRIGGGGRSGQQEMDRVRGATATI